MPSWKKVIVSGSSAHVLNITASNLPNLYKNHVLMYNTASGVITYFTSSLEPPPNAVLQSGSVKYDNTTLTPMTNTTVKLFDESGNFVISYTTNATTGDFNFGQVPVGNYYVQFQTNKPWGGVNLSDMLRISRHTMGNLLTGIRQLAADVDGDDVIDISDITLIDNAFVQSSTLGISNYRGDWVFGSGSGANFRGWYGINAPTVGNPALPNGVISPSNGAVSSMGIPLTASANNTNLQYRALCLGDVDGSHIP